MINQQLQKRQLSLSNLVSILCILALIFTALPSYGLSTSDSSIGKNESYTITYQRGANYRLQEKIGTNGRWKFLARSQSGNKTLSKSVADTYYYRTYRIGCGGRFWGKRRGGGGGCSHVSKPISVNVLPGPLVPLDAYEVQQQYQFETRLGDINSDGLKDIYIRRLSGHANNGVISQTILVQYSNRTFKIHNASSSQLTEAKSWSKVNIVAALGDFNLDGYVDVFLKGVSSVLIGVKDQLVFSSGMQYNGKAQAVTNIDDNFKKTFGSVANWIVDKDYFKDNMITRYKWVIYPAFVWNPRTDKWEPILVPGRQKYYEYDSDLISQDAVSIKNALFDIFKVGIDKSPYETINKLANYLSDSLGVEVSIGSKSNECKDAGFVKSLVVVANPATLQVCRIALGKILQTIARVSTIGESLEDKGEMIFRVFGGQATMEGRSWTPVNPIGYPDYRNGAGLPKANACTSLVMGIVKQSNRSQYIVRPALPVLGPGDYYKKGGLVEYLFHTRPLKSLGIIKYGRVVPMSPPC